MISEWNLYIPEYCKLRHLYSNKNASSDEQCHSIVDIVENNNYDEEHASLKEIPC